MTANAVPSSAAEDLLLNARALDEFINSTSDSLVTRLGVTKETLKGAVYALRFFNNRGNWAAITDYALKDLVLFSGTWYVCIEPHTSGGSFAANAAKFVVHQTSLVVSILMQSLLDDTTTDEAQSTLGATALGKSLFTAVDTTAARSALGIATYADLGVTQSFTKAQRGTPVPLTDAATVAVDMALANNFTLTLGGNRTLGAPTNQVAGQGGVIVITQDGTGSRTLAYNSVWKFPGGTVPTLTTTAGAVDVIAYQVESGGRITARMISDVK
jgi:hypothetical protein